MTDGPHIPHEAVALPQRAGDGETAPIAEFQERNDEEIDSLEERRDSFWRRVRREQDADRTHLAGQVAKALQ